MLKYINKGLIHYKASHIVWDCVSGRQKIIHYVWLACLHTLKQNKAISTFLEYWSFKDSTLVISVIYPATINSIMCRWKATEGGLRQCRTPAALDQLNTFQTHSIDLFPECIWPQGGLRALLYDLHEENKHVTRTEGWNKLTLVYDSWDGGDRSQGVWNASMCSNICHQCSNGNIMLRWR